MCALLQKVAWLLSLRRARNRALKVDFISIVVQFQSKLSNNNADCTDQYKITREREGEREREYFIAHGQRLKHKSFVCFVVVFLFVVFFVLQICR